MSLLSSQLSSRTEYQIDVDAEQGEERDHSVDQRDETETKILQRLALKGQSTDKKVSELVVGYADTNNE